MHTSAVSGLPLKSTSMFSQSSSKTKLFFPGTRGSILGQRPLNSATGEEELKQRVGEPQENKLNVRGDVGRNRRAQR